MQEHTEEFMKSAYCNRFSEEVLHSERMLHHALDNYGMVMPDNLESAIREAEKKLQQIQTEIKKWRNSVDREV